MTIGLADGAQSASLDDFWKARGGDLGGPGLVAGVSRITESIFGCLRESFGVVAGPMVGVHGEWSWRIGSALYGESYRMWIGKGGEAR